VPVSTTHTVTGAIAGTGLVHGPNNVHWNVLKRIALSWVLTLPAAALISAAMLFTFPK
jgi:PiT family inorganic phosphate transporter